MVLRRVAVCLGLYVALLPVAGLGQTPCPAPIQRACLFDTALELVADDPWTLAWIAGHLVRAGQIDRATALLGTLTDARDRQQALDQMAQAHVDREEFDAALALTVDLTGTNTMLDGRLRDIAAGFAQAGRVDEALALVPGIADPQIRTQALERIVSAQITLGLTDQARATAGQIAPDAIRAQVLARLGGALSDPDLLAQAQALIATLPEAHRRAHARHVLAEAQAQAGLASDARTTAAGIDDPVWRAIALGRVAAAQGDAVGIEQAIALARAIPEAGQRGNALTVLGGVLVRADLLDEAREHLLTIPLESIRDIGLGALFEHQLRLGLVDAAAQTARALASDSLVIALLARVHRVRPDPDILAEVLARLEGEQSPALRAHGLARIAGAMVE